MPALNDPFHEAFVQHYSLTGSSTQAVIAAGGSPRSAGITGWGVLHRPEVQTRLREIYSRRFAKESITAERVIHEVARGAFYDIRDLFDHEGQPLPPHLLPDDVAAIVSQIKVELKSSGKGDDRSVSTVLTYKLVDKASMLTLLAKHFKIVGDESDGINSLANILSDRLNSARARDNAYATEARIIEPENMAGVSMTYTLEPESADTLHLQPPAPEDPVPHQGDSDEERLW